MKKTLLLSTVLSQESGSQVVQDLQKFINSNGKTRSANVDDVEVTLKNCRFFMFRHHRSAADRFERIVKSDENAHLLSSMIAIEEAKLDGMDLLVNNYQEEALKCEPILLSNVLSVEKYHKKFLSHYNNLSVARKQAVEDMIYIRMRNFERALTGGEGKRLKKAEDKGFADNYVFETSLSPKYKKSQAKKIKNYIEKHFDGEAPELLEPFKSISDKYATETIAEINGKSKAQQLVDYIFNNQVLGVLDWKEYPADTVQADQLKRFILRGDDKPALYESKPELKALVDAMADILRKDSYDDIERSWFSQLVGVEGKEVERNSSNDVSRDGYHMEGDEQFADWLENEIPQQLREKEEEESSNATNIYNIGMFLMSMF